MSTVTAAIANAETPPTAHGYWKVEPDGSRETHQPPPPAPGFRITELTAFIAIDPDDDSEGIINARTPKGDFWPLIAADEDRILTNRKVAQETANELGRPVKLVKFSVREDVGVIEPE